MQEVERAGHSSARRGGNATQGSAAQRDGMGWEGMRWGWSEEWEVEFNQIGAWMGGADVTHRVRPGQRTIPATLLIVVLGVVVVPMPRNASRRDLAAVPVVVEPAQKAVSQGNDTSPVVACEMMTC